MPFMSTEFRKWYRRIVSNYLESLIKKYIFPTRDVSTTDGMKIDAQDWMDIRKKGDRDFAFFDNDNFITMLIMSDPSKLPLSIFRIRAEGASSAFDTKFAGCIAKVFNQDLSWCAKLSGEHRSQAWVRLQQTQFTRAIACFLCKNPDAIENWLRAAENSMTLTYEGKSVHPTIVFYSNPKRLNRRLEKNYYKFPELVPVRELFEQKWIRSVVEGQRVALVGDLESTMLTGFMSPNALEPPSAQKEPLYAPHISLRFIQAALGLSGIAMVVSEQGELFVMQGRQVVFRKSQGRWQYINYAYIHQILSKTIPEETILHLLRSAIDLSFEHRGALFCVLDKARDLADMVPDHKKKTRANRILRKTLYGLNIKQWQYERQLITSAAATDGAVILSPDGKVLDVACMIGPCINRIQDLELKDPSTPGSRSSAAWRASLYGLSLKVSADGPIVGYRMGEQILQIG